MNQALIDKATALTGSSASDLDISLSTLANSTTPEVMLTITATTFEKISEGHTRAGKTHRKILAKHARIALKKLEGA